MSEHTCLYDSETHICQHCGKKSPLARQEGYYWVKFLGTWHCGFWDGEEWVVIVDELNEILHLKDSSLEINHARILSPDEYNPSQWVRKTDTGFEVITDPDLK